MATPEAIQVSSLPLPPMQYINLFSDENVRRGRAPRPPPPIHDNYSMFGNVFNADDNIIRPLEAQGIKRLYPQHFDRRRELKKLNHSLLVNFLDLIDLLVQCPDSPRRTEKVLTCLRFIKQRMSEQSFEIFNSFLLHRWKIWVYCLFTFIICSMNFDLIKRERRYELWWNCKGDSELRLHWDLISTLTKLVSAAWIVALQWRMA